MTTKLRSLLKEQAICAHVQQEPCEPQSSDRKSMNYGFAHPLSFAMPWPLHFENSCILKYRSVILKKGTPEMVRTIQKVDCRFHVNQEASQAPTSPPAWQLLQGQIPPQPGMTMPRSPLRLPQRLLCCKSLPKLSRSITFKLSFVGPSARSRLKCAFCGG